MSRRIFILGSTGSIGCNTVEVVQHLRSIDGEGSWPVIGLAANTNGSLLLEQATTLGAEAISLENGGQIDFSTICTSAYELISNHAKKGDLVVAAIVGFAGIAPVLKAIERGCDIALANKETLVAGGKIVMEAVQKAGVSILPVDSEHSAVFQALAKHPNSEIAKITLTASGGSLREMPFDQIHNASVEQVLNHPTWDMGKKVTVDSASLMNKALELIEAHWLFDVGSDRLDAIIHPQSIVHAMVEFNDGSIIAQLSEADMKLPIQFALTWPEREKGCCKTVDWAKCHSLEFEEVDPDRYPAIALAYWVIGRGGTAGAVFNAANEVVVDAFLEHSLPFGSMVAIVEEVLHHTTICDCVDYESVVEADREAREQTAKLLASFQVNS